MTLILAPAVIQVAGVVIVGAVFIQSVFLIVSSFRRLAIEREHIQRYPEEEQAHLAVLLAENGLDPEDAERVAAQVHRRLTSAVGFHALFELGIHPGSLGLPRSAALWSFVSFAVGAIVPLLPWLLVEDALLGEEVPMAGLDTLWLQIGGTVCNLTCTHCFISCTPQNNNHPLMTLAQVQKHLEESKHLGIKDYYITGGEVFLNPELLEIYEAILAYGPCHTLTNGLLISKEKAQKLAALQSRAPNTLNFRVSLDSLDEKENDAIRGRNCFKLALRGIRYLAEAGFSAHLTMVRSWDDEDDPVMEVKALAFMREHGVTNPQVKFLPGFMMGELAVNERDYHPNERVTEKCFENFPITNLQCSSSRMVTAKGVYVCPILIEEDQARMGDTVEETLRPFPLYHSACYTCRVSGMSCKS